MSIERVKAYFKENGLEDRIMEFEGSSATVELAAQALNCEPCRIAKTLAFRMGRGCALVVTAGDARIDNSKFKACFQIKAKMLSREETEEEIGHAVGRRMSFCGQRRNSRVFGRISQAV